MIAIVAGVAPWLRMMSSTSTAVATFCGYGMPAHVWRPELEVPFTLTGAVCITRHNSATDLTHHAIQLSTPAPLQACCGSTLAVPPRCTRRAATGPHCAHGTQHAPTAQPLGVQEQRRRAQTRLRHSSIGPAHGTWRREPRAQRRGHKPTHGRLAHVPLWSLRHLCFLHADAAIAAHVPSLCCAEAKPAPRSLQCAVHVISVASLQLVVFTV